MKRYLFVMAALSLAFPAAAQQRIEWRRDKVTQIIFPADVVKFRTGYTSDDAISQSDGRVMYIQPVDAMPETNLNVQTADGRYYAFDVIYNNAASEVNYIVSPSMAIYQEEQLSEDPQTEPRSLGTEQPAAVDENPVERLTPEQLFAKVRKQPDYIVANNVARLQKLTILLKGVYVDEAHVYFKFRLGNSSNVPFDVDYIAFSVTARKTKKTSTQERLQILPVGVDTKIHRVDAKSSCEVIYRFEKFTIGKEKILLAEVLEQGGDRNITLRIPEDFIIEARRL